ncbi:hypothetical protein ACF5W4_08560 [Bacillota bacterium Lsc_1132]
MFNLFGMFPVLLIYLLFFGLVIYFIIRALRFMDEKTTLEKERNAKLQQIAKALEIVNKKDG